MARGDRRGPDGRGPLTGRGMGYCAGYDEPGYTAGGGRGFFGRGARGFFGRGARGRGFYGAERGFFGRGAGAYYETEPVDEKEYLEEEKSYLEKRLASIKEILDKK